MSAFITLRTVDSAQIAMSTRSYHDALAQLNTLQKGICSLAETKRPKLTSPERIRAWLQYLDIDVSAN